MLREKNLEIFFKIKFQSSMYVHSLKHCSYVHINIFTRTFHLLTNISLRRFLFDKRRAGRSGDRIQVVARFSAPVETGPGAHPASYTMDTGSLPGVKRPERGVDHPPPSIAEVERRVAVYLYSHSGPSWPYGELYLYL